MDQSKIDQIKSKLESLNVQMYLGRAEAIEEFENQKANIKAYVHDSKQKLESLQAEAGNQLTDLKTKLEELNLQVSLGRAEAEDALQEQQKNISHKLSEVKAESQRIYGDSKEKVREFSAELEEQMDHYHMKYDLFRLQLNLGISEANEAWDDKKKDLSYKFQELTGKIERSADSVGEKMEDFSDEMSEAWKHIRKAFS